ncbi:MAG: phosphatidylglycerol lysyltransferase domain-containing protein, partial [Minisyncoccia bacterium]
KKDIEKLTHKFLPYSDFDFISMWSWDIKEEMKISNLNDNLVVRFSDYLTGKPHFSFLGINKSEDTVCELINFAKESGMPTTLYLITEEIAKSLEGTSFFIEEDKNNFDYIFSISQLSELRGLKFKEKRHSASRFLREYPDAVFEVKELNDPNVREQIVSVFNNWEKKKELDKKEYDFEHKHEEKAIHRLLQIENDNKIIVSCVSLNNVVVGFSIDEILPSQYAISHFFKADVSYRGIYDFLNKKVSQHLADNNVSLWSWEQDLGIESLRRSKTSYRPVNFLKKYKVSLTSKK